MTEPYRNISERKFNPYAHLIDGDEDPWKHVPDPNRVNLARNSSPVETAIAAKALDGVVTRPKHRATNSQKGV